MANAGSEAKREGTTLDCLNKDIIRNIFEKCKYESTHGLQIPLELYKERVLFYTNAPEDLVDEINGEKKTTLETDLCDRAVINNALKKLYSQHKTFSFIEIYETVKDKMKVADINNFCRMLRHLGYNPINTLNYGQIIIEDPKLTFQRFGYLSKITKLRDTSKIIYYIDERIIDLNRTFKKPWMDENKDILSQVDGYVFFHIVSKTGLEKGLFCNKANAEDFHKWVSDIVLSFIKPSSIIIMDNSPLHGKTLSEPITRFHSKADMLKWLQRNNVPCSPNMHKVELYDLIARCPIRDNQYRLDLIFKSHGHEVLRLPENYHDLSVTELLWEHIRSSTFDFQQTSTLYNLKTKVYNAVTSIRQDKWLEFESIIKDTEKDMFAVDEAIELALDTYKVIPKNAN